MRRQAKPLSVVPASKPAPVARPAGDAPLAPVIALRDLKIHCTTCSMRELCLTDGFTADELEQIDALVGMRTRLRRQHTLYRAGDPFHALYAIRRGSLKSTVLSENGREQVAGFHMLGDIVGLDGIGTGRHGLQTVALEDSEACVLPFHRIEELARSLPRLQRNLHQIMSREISREQSAMLMLGSMRAEERLAVFLLNLAERYRHRGYSSTEYVLRLTRDEIGSYLGLKLETVSRLFSRFHEEGLVQVQGRGVKLLDPLRLRRIVGQRG